MKNTNTNTKLNYLPNIQIIEEEINNININTINPIDFLSEEENMKIIERIKDGLRNINNPDRWLTWEECDKKLREKYFINNV